MNSKKFKKSNYSYSPKKWYQSTPPTLSSLCSADETSGEYNNWAAYKKCIDNRVDYKQFPSRPTINQIDRVIETKKNNTSDVKTNKFIL